MPWCELSGYSLGMSRSVSLLQGFGPADLHLDPFPHIILKNALPAQLCDELRSTFPSLESQGVDPTADNKRWSTPARVGIAMPNLPDLWKQLLAYHISQAFLDEVLTVFSTSLLSLYPRLFPNETALRSITAIARDDESFPSHALALDVQICGNTPVRTPGQPNKVHFDATNALYAGLYYLRDDDDDSIGGDLQLWRWKSGYSYRKKSSEYDEDISPKHVQLVKTIPYKANTFVLLLNGIDSLHSVTRRESTMHTRKFVNVLADSSNNLFSLDPLPHLRVRNIVRRRIRSRLKRRRFRLAR